jgi:hypothetical protein
MLDGRRRPGGDGRRRMRRLSSARLNLSWRWPLSLSASPTDWTCGGSRPDFVGGRPPLIARGIRSLGLLLERLERGDARHQGLVFGHGWDVDG